MKYYLICLLIVSLFSWEIESYGRVWDPVHRGSAWRKGFPTPINYEDNMNQCGGFAAQHYKNGGKCGFCGDNFAEPTPRDNENKGKYGTGTIVRRYKENQTIEVLVDLTANLGGFFNFSICDLSSIKSKLEKESCFIPMLLEDGSKRYDLPDLNTIGLLSFNVTLPKNFACDQCVFRWQYTAANNWGICPDGHGDLGCGPQETFRTCSDVSVVRK